VNLQIKSYSLFLVLFCFWSITGLAQKRNYANEQEKLSIIEQRIEYFAENSGEEEPDLNALFDRLLHYIDHPLDLNTATKTDLTELSLINDVQINELLLHIERNGKLLSIYEIQCLPSWDQTIIDQVLPFIYVTDRFNQPHLSIDELLKSSTQELYLRWSKVLEDQKGYFPTLLNPTPAYPGSNDRLYTRYRFKAGNFLSIGFTAEKDQGEQFFKGAQKNGFDFYSGHAFIRDLGIVKQLALGDYLVSFGQGLTMGMGVAMGKTASTLNVKRSAYKLKPYTSVDENLFLRGAATTLKFGNLETTVFASSKKIDANVTTTTDTLEGADDGIVVSSFLNSGSHATTSEIADKHAISQNLAGAHISYGKRTFEIGTTFYNVNYSATLNKSLAPYNQYDFTGNNNFVGGIDYTAIFRNMHFFGETSMSKSKGIGSVNGVIIGLDPKVGLTIMHRYYQRNFQNLYTNALAEASRAQNESGLYFGVEMKPTNKWIINSYADMFQSQWLRFGVNAPSKGNEYLAQLTYRPNKVTEMYVRYRNRNKEFNTDVDMDDVLYTVNQNQTNVRFNLIHKIGKNFALHTRIEQVTIKREDEPNSVGYLAFQDLFYKPLSSPFSFNLRYAIFSTDDYNSRVYAYESDVLYYYAIPSYYYKGSRMYLNVRYQYKKWLDVWVKIGRWMYDNRTTVGSGNDEIQGNKKTEIRVQMRISF